MKDNKIIADLAQLKQCALHVLLFFLLMPVFAQEETFLQEAEFLASEITPVSETESALTPARQRLEMEIRTSSLSELALWCRTLGLSESGTRAELSERLRNHFDLPQPAQDSSRRIITIESAQITEYFTIDVIGEDYARLRGNVSLSLIDGSTVHKIRADEILFNRTRNIVSARGQVIYERYGDDVTETFRGENITVNLDSWSSIFLDGSTTHTLDSDGTAYLFSGSVISRGDEDVTILTDARITNAVNEEALWSISASRLWLLPGSDFALLNAVLKVGEIPVLYIPFFYLPGDELFFHPVIGYRGREGAFIQTTTYILGQPRSSPSDTGSISRILRSSDNSDVELEGLFLRSTGKRESDPNELSLKIMVDYYVNLGFYLGLDLSVPKTGIMNPLDFSFGLGFTRTVSRIGGSYTPYIVKDQFGHIDGSFDWNHSSLFSLPVPFRYRMRLSSSLSGRFSSLSWDLPLYSDPVINRDLLNRSENMDWVNMIQQGASLDINNTTQNEIRSYQWHINGAITPQVQFMSPYVSRINISNISTSLSFKTLTDRSKISESPEYLFYAPDKYTIYNLSLSISGTPLSLGSASSGQPNSSGSGTEDNDPLRGIGSPVSPWPEAENETDSAAAQSHDGGNYSLTPPVLNQRFNLPGTGNTTFSIDYQITPASSTELQFMSGRWDSYNKVNWGEVQSILASISGSGTINFRVNHTSGLFSNVLTFSGNGTWRDYAFLNEEADIFLTNNVIDENKIENARRQIYSQTNYSTAYAYTGTVRPFYENPVFSQTSFQYNIRGALLRSKRHSGGDGPELTPLWGSWVKDGQDMPGLTGHRFTANAAVNIRDYNQNLSLSIDIPPLDWQISANAVIRFWLSETNINFRIERPMPASGSSSDAGEWIFRPINITETLRFPDNIGSFVFNMAIDPHDNTGVTNISASLSLWNIRLAFSAVRSQLYNFIWTSGSGQWVQDSGDPVLNPRLLSLSYSNSFPNTEIVRDFLFLSFDINTSLAFDLQRYTNSNFQLTLGFKLVIPEFLELSLSATSQNSVIWRYFKDFPGMENLTSMYPSGQQNNLFIDLFDSFNFFDESRRRRSGFKIQRFNMSITHFLGDWHAQLSASMYPYRDTSRNDPNFRITADVSFIIQWRPITELKSDITYNGRDNRWEMR